jgi:hypothetical protein
MKKIVLISTVLLSITFACKKTSKGKMSNDWVVTSFSSKSTEVESNGDSTVSLVKIDGALGEGNIVEYNNGTQSSSKNLTGDIREFTLSIDKKTSDWNAYKDITWTYSVNGATFSEFEQTTSKGKWFFESKADEFKKNEIVTFETYEEISSVTESTTMNGVTSKTEYSSVNNYNIGDNVVKYIVVESKRNELKLKVFESTSINEGFIDLVEK